MLDTIKLRTPELKKTERRKWKDKRRIEGFTINLHEFEQNM
jgi:hypothetical protein